MFKLQVIALAGAAALSATTAIAAEPEWRTTRVALPDGSQAEIRYVGDVPPQVTVAMPARQPRASIAGEIDGESEASDSGILRARRIVQPPHATPLVAAPAPQLAMPHDAPRGSTYHYTLITTGIDGKVCAQRTEWTSRGRGKEPMVRRNDTGEGCATLLASPPVTPPPATSAIIPVDPDIR